MRKSPAELEIYKCAYLLARELHKVRTKMPRGLKHDLGAEMMGSILKVIRCIIEAAKRKEKKAVLHALLTECELLWTWLRLGLDLQGMSQGEFRLLGERLDELSRQGAAWMRWSGKPETAPSKGL